MSSQLAVSNGTGVSIMHEVIVKGDLSKLSDDERAIYYAKVCESINVNPLTKPFEYIELNRKLTLYATKTCTDQLRTVRGVSVFRVDAETTADGLRIVTAYARDAAGREDMDLGVVNVKGLSGEALANAYMKALTKAKRRVTLSICGLGWLDESEIESVPSARPIQVNVETGEIIDGAAAADVESNAVVANVWPITSQQMKHVQALRGELGMTPEQLREMAGVASAKELTAQQADDIIAELESLRTAKQAAARADAEAQEPMIAGTDPERWTR